MKKTTKKNKKIREVRRGNVLRRIHNTKVIIVTIGVGLLRPILFYFDSSNKKYGP